MIKIIQNKQIRPYFNRFKNIKIHIKLDGNQIVVCADFELTDKSTKYRLLETIDRTQKTNTVNSVILSMRTTVPELITIQNFTKITFNEVDSLQDTSYQNIIKFYTDNDELVLYLFAPETTYEGFENAIVIDDVYCMPYRLFEECPKADELYFIWQKKQRIVGNQIDMASSITYLESEIDTLYAILKSIVQKTGIDISEYQDIIDSVNKNSVLNIKSHQKIVHELETDKNKMRKIQSDYYNEKK